MKHFVTVLTDTCKVENIHYVIHTSIHLFIYRIEVFQDGHSSYITEIMCDELQDQPNNEQLFIEKYHYAHRSTRDKFCKQIEKNIHIQKPEYNLKKMKKSDTLLNSNMNLKKILVGLLLAIVIVWLTYEYIFTHSNIYSYVFDTKEAKIQYLENEESHAKALGEKCLKLSKKKLENNENIITVKNCTVWCQKNIITSSKCNLFLAYFKVNYKNTNLSDKLHKKYIEKKVLDYQVIPQNNIIELDKKQNFDLTILNRSKHAILVKLKDLILDHKNEEIVQFRELSTELLVQGNDKKSFHIFLEPSYYIQFDSGKYTGKFIFEITYKQNKETFTQAFFFVVS